MKMALLDFFIFNFLVLNGIFFFYWIFEIVMTQLGDKNNSEFGITLIKKDVGEGRLPELVHYLARDTGFELKIICPEKVILVDKMKLLKPNSKLSVSFKMALDKSGDNLILTIKTCTAIYLALAFMMVSGIFISVFSFYQIGNNAIPLFTKNFLPAMILTSAFLSTWYVLEKRSAKKAAQLIENAISQKPQNNEV
jgi:hypothetical protein